MSGIPTGKLRVLATTDLHMQLLDYDYFADRTDHSIGLIGLADQIKSLRDEKGITTLLCDNGDLIQGNPLADHLAAHPAHSGTHPMIAALNLLQYDAMTLGNHEFDYGLEFLHQTMSKATFPVVSANIFSRTGRAFAKSFALLERDILCSDGVRRGIKLGITGFGPPQIAEWNTTGNAGDVGTEDIVDAARQVAPKMRAAGADVTIALCHSGISQSTQKPRMENAALPLATVEGIDVLLLGHTHGVFPDPDAPLSGDRTGHLHGKPAVMAACYGKALGLITLDMQWNKGAWVIAGQSVGLRHARPPDFPESPLRQTLRKLVAAPHAATLARLRAPIAQTSVPIQSYFATIQPDLSQQLLARALQGALRPVLARTEYAAFPLLAAKSPYRSGVRSGAEHFIDIPAGPITLRDVAAIFPFADRASAVRRSGKQIRLWLERAAAHYNQMRPGLVDQPLINPRSAGYNCDAIFGLSYQIDISQPARFDTEGHEINPAARRIVHLKRQGKPIRDDDIFIVATNSFRARGGGGFPAIAQEDFVHVSPQSVREHLIAYLKKVGTVDIPLKPTWSFAPLPKTAAVFATAPQARDHLHPPISHIGPCENGLARYRITF